MFSPSNEQLETSSPSYPAEGAEVLRLLELPNGTFQYDLSNMEIIGSDRPILLNDRTFVIATAVLHEKGTNLTVPYSYASLSILPPVSTLEEIATLGAEGRVLMFPSPMPAREGALPIYVGSQILSLTDEVASLRAPKSASTVEVFGSLWHCVPHQEGVWYSTMTKGEASRLIVTLATKLLPMCESLCHTAVRSVQDGEKSGITTALDLLALSGNVLTYADSVGLSGSIRAPFEVLSGVLFRLQGKSTEDLNIFYQTFMRYSFQNGSWETYLELVQDKHAELLTI